MLALWMVCLLEAGPARSACDKNGRQAVFGIEDKWEVPGKSYQGRADFTKACDALLDCYSTEGAIRTACDRIYEKNLKGACRTAFEFKSNPLMHCVKNVDKAVEFVSKADGATYRKMQRAGRAAKREAERKARAQARQARIDERRKKRRAARIRGAE